MLDSITSYLIQARECSLPGIGHFQIATQAATADIANKTMLPPYNEVLFQNQPKQEEDFGLIKYIASKKDIDEASAERKLKIFCISLNNNLSLGKIIDFPSLGSLQRDDNGIAFFKSANNIQLAEPVVAERVIHENTSHAVLVGDKETTSDVQTRQLSTDINVEVKTKNQWWKIAAMILFIIGIGIVLFQFYNHGIITGN
ncbi:MAG: hypothetical protein ABI204_08110, partial [Ginsengibacter sp.]